MMIENEEMQIKTLKAYEEGINDLMRCVKKIVCDVDDGGLTCNELEEIYGDKSYVNILSEYSALELMAKLKGWEMDKEAKRVDES